jgi:hypothetical protein
MVFDGSSWTIARDWNSNPMYPWRPTVPGTYRVGIWVRDATSTSNSSAISQFVTFTVVKN